DGIGRTLTTSTVGTDTQTTTTYAYQGNTVTVTDATGKWKKYTTDALGQLVQVNEPNPASSGSSTSYALSSNGAVASASSQYNSNFPASSVNDGDKLGSNWGNGGGWNDAAGPPSWVEID